MSNSMKVKQSGWVDVMVVDARPADYGNLAAAVGTEHMSFRFARTASDALRMAKQSPRAVWLVNVALPDMSGAELLTLLRERDPQMTGYLVGEWYRSEDELDTRVCGAAAYVCKPAVAEWLTPWVRSSQQKDMQTLHPLRALG